MFTSSTSAINYFRNFSPSAPFINLHLVSGSPAIGSGANGTDMGIYGGSFPWRDNPLGGGFSYFPGPGLPEIYTIINPVIATPNSTIQIRVKARNVY